MVDRRAVSDPGYDGTVPSRLHRAGATLRGRGSPVYDAGQFVPTPMTVSRGTIRRWIGVAALILGSCLAVCGQDSSGQAPSLGDVARKTRKERSAAGHVPGKQLVNEEEDGPDTTGIWRVRLCTRTPCDELSVTLPKEAKWTRPKEEPRPVLLPLPGLDKDPGRVIRLYVAESLGPVYSPVDGAKRLFVQ